MGTLSDKPIHTAVFMARSTRHFCRRTVVSWDWTCHRVDTWHMATTPPRSAALGNLEISGTCLVMSFDSCGFSWTLWQILPLAIACCFLAPLGLWWSRRSVCLVCQEDQRHFDLLRVVAVSSASWDRADRLWWAPMLGDQEIPRSQ